MIEVKAKGSIVDVPATVDVPRSSSRPSRRRSSRRRSPSRHPRRRSVRRARRPSTPTARRRHRARARRRRRRARGSADRRAAFRGAPVERAFAIAGRNACDPSVARADRRRSRSASPRSRSSSTSRCSAPVDRGDRCDDRCGRRCRQRRGQRPDARHLAADDAAARRRRRACRGAVPRCRPRPSLVIDDADPDSAEREQDERADAARSPRVVPAADPARSRGSLRAPGRADPRRDHPADRGDADAQLPDAPARA